MDIQHLKIGYMINYCNFMPKNKASHDQNLEIIWLWIVSNFVIFFIM